MYSFLINQVLQEKFADSDRNRSRDTDLPPLERAVTVNVTSIHAIEQYKSYTLFYKWVFT